MKFELFKNQFHESWHKWVQPIIENPKFDEGFSMIKNFAKTGKVIPSYQTNNLFRIFREVPFDKVKTVVVGLSPYNIYVNNKEVADGIAISCSSTGVEQPTLTQWYDAMTSVYGKNIIRDPDLKYLCEQGVFLYNYSLTCEYKDATSHIPAWEFFSTQLFKTAISNLEVPVIMLGKEAAKVESHLMPWQKTFVLKHPAWASYNKTQWSDEGAFEEVKKHIQDKNIPFSWVKYKEQF